MTRNGRAYRQRLWVPAISGTGGGALPTPLARDHFPPHSLEYIAKKKAEGHGMSALNDWAAHSLLPTPQAREAQMLPTPVAQTGAGDPKGLDGGSGARQMLTDAGFPRAAGAPSSLPTPKAGDGERGRDKARARPDLKGRELATVLRDQLPTPRTCSAMAAPVNSRGNLEGERFPNLETVIGRQLLTPCASGWKGRTNWEAAERHGPQRLPDCLPTGAATYLNPSFVEEMMGYPVGWTA